MGFQVDRAAHRILVLVKGDRQMRSQVYPIALNILALVKGNRQMRFQVDRAIRRFWFWLKEITRWDLNFTELFLRF
jgi:hypothetical protein